MPETRPSNVEILTFITNLQEKLDKPDHDKLVGYVSYLVVTVSLLEDESEFIDLMCEANDSELPVLETIAERAGLLWRCYNNSVWSPGEPCGTLNYIGVDKCSECEASIDELT